MPEPFSKIPVIDVSLLDTSYATGNLSTVIAQLAEEHGPVFRWVSRGAGESGQTRVTMVGPEANRFVMHTHRHAFSHQIGWSPMINDALGHGLLTMDDPEHAVHRRMWNPAFAASYMGTYLPIMQRVIEERTATWPDSGEIDLYAESRRITFDIAAAALAGFTTGAEVDELRSLFYALLHGFDPDNGTLDDYVAGFYSIRTRLFSALTLMIEERRAAPPDRRPRDVLSLIIDATDDEGRHLTDEQVLGHLNILLVAGHETTTTLGAWALYNMATMPDHHSRLMQELPASGSASSLSIDDIRSLKHLDNFVRETGRLYPPVLHVPRGVTQDVEFAGYTIPRGTTVRLSLGASHLLPSVWTDPHRFDPDRLAPPREEDRRTPYALVTFGGGPRVCIGQHFAMIETKALVAHVIRRFQLEPLSPNKPIHAGFFNAFIPGGLKMQVRRI